MSVTKIDEKGDVLYSGSVVEHRSDGTVCSQRLGRKGPEREQDQLESHVSIEIGPSTEKRRSWVICNLKQLPTWMQDNRYLLNGHRPELASYRMCLWSIFRLHTETGNIWTHFLSSCLFAYFAFCFFAFLPIQLQLYDKLVFGTFFFGVISFFTFSSIHHTFRCHSKIVNKRCLRLDQCGTALIVAGYYIPWLYYAFYCNYLEKVIYLGVVSVLGVATVVVCITEMFVGPEQRTTRTSVFAAYGLSVAIPVLHWLLAHDWYSIDSLRGSVTCMVLMTSVALVGSLLCAFRIPEKYFPGKCDYYFQSNQLFHILIAVSAVLQLMGVAEMALFVLKNSICDIGITF